MSDKPYDPKPGSVPYRVIAWLEQQPKGSEFTTSQIAEALGLMGPQLHPCLEPAVRHGALHARRRDEHRTAPLWWSLSPRAPASVAVALPREAVPPPAPKPAAAPAATPAPAAPAAADTPTKPVLPVPAPSLRISLCSDGTLEVQRASGRVVYSADETRQLVRFFFQPWSL